MSDCPCQGACKPAQRGALLQSVSDYDLTDWLAVAMLVASAVYVFVHPSDVAYGVFGGVLTGFHGLRIFDQKRPDA